jgi:hypothetical protein
MLALIWLRGPRNQLDFLLLGWPLVSSLIGLHQRRIAVSGVLLSLFYSILERSFIELEDVWVLRIRGICEC